MPFWRNDFKAASFCRQITTVQYFSISLISILLSFLFFLLFFYHPAVSQIKKLNQENQALIQQKERLKLLFSQIKQLESESESLLKRINCRYQKRDTAELMMNILQKHDLLCSDIKPVKSKQKHLFKKDYFSVSVKGIFKDCVEMLMDLQSSGQVIKICELKMYKWKANKIKFDLEFRGICVTT